MSRVVVILFWGLVLIGCNKDKMGPNIQISELSFCVDPGQDIMFTLEITDEDLKEVNMTAPDLDFIKTFEADIFQNSDDIVDFTFTIDPDTPTGNYVIGIEALDLDDNSSTEVVELKVN